MVEFIIGRAGSGKTGTITERLRQNTEKNNEKTSYILVPDQEMVVWENRISKEIDTRNIANIRVVSFASLADLAFRKFGSVKYEYISNGAKELVMWQAIRESLDKMAYYRNASVSTDRYVSTFAGAVNELKRNGIDPEKMGKSCQMFREELIKNTDMKQDKVVLELLADKMDDLKLVYEKYETRVQQGFNDREDELREFISVVKDKRFFEGTDVYIDSFFTMFPLQKIIAREIIKKADNVYMTFSHPGTDITGAHVGEMQFENNHMFLGEMLKSARERTDLKITILDQFRRNDKADLIFLERNMWNFRCKGSYSGAPQNIKMISCGDRYEEARVVCSGINRMIRDGAKYSEIAVVARDMEKLRGILDTQLSFENIPYYFSERYDVLQQSAYKLILSSMRVITGGWRTEDVIVCAKSGYFGLSDFESSSFEEYMETWALRGRKRIARDLWNMNPDGYTTNISGNNKERKQAAEDAREKIVKFLEKFGDEFEGAEDFKGKAKALYRYLSDLCVPDRLNDETDRLQNEGRYQEAQRSSVIWKSICGLMDTIVDMVGDEKCESDVFLRLFRDVAGEEDIGTIPTGTDQVILGSANQLRPGRVKHVIIVGAIEGEFPASVTDNGYFTDIEKRILEQIDLNFAEKTENRTSDELFWFYRIVSMPSESLTIIVPHINFGDETAESSGVLRIKELFPEMAVEEWKDFTVRDKVFTKEEALDEIQLASEDEKEVLMEEAGISEIPGGTLDAGDSIISKRITDEIYKKGIWLSKTRISNFQGCRFKFYCGDILNLICQKEAEVNPLYIGNLVHKVLEKFFREHKNDDFPIEDKVIAEDTESLIKEYIRDMLMAEPSAKFNYIMERMKKKIITLIKEISIEFTDTSFRPAFFEFKIGGEGADPLECSGSDGTKINFTGAIDRIDLCDEGDKVLVKVVDYKTGADNYKAGKDIIDGENLQLYIYLFSLTDGKDEGIRKKLNVGNKELVPAVAEILNTGKDMTDTSSVEDSNKEEIEKLIRKEVQKSGFALDTPEVQENLGEEEKNPKKKKWDFFSSEEMEQKYSELIDVMRELADQIKSGDIGAKPVNRDKKNPCTYCDYRPVCRVDVQEGEDPQ